MKREPAEKVVTFYHYSSNNPGENCNISPPPLEYLGPINDLVFLGDDAVVRHMSFIKNRKARVILRGDSVRECRRLRALKCKVTIRLNLLNTISIFSKHERNCSA